MTMDSSFGTPGAFRDPMKPVKDKLNDIEKKIDKLSEESGKNNDTEIKSIKEDISNIAKSLTDIVNGMEDDDARQQNRKETELHVTQSVNENINTQMSIIKADLKKTQFGVSIRPEDKAILQSAIGILSKNSSGSIVGELKAYVDKLNEIVNKVNGAYVEKALSATTDEWLKKYKASMSKSIEDVYKEVEKKREDGGKAIVLSMSTFYIFFLIFSASITFGFWGMTKVLDRETILVVLFLILGFGMVIGGLQVWMKFKTWRDNRKFRY